MEINGIPNDGHTLYKAKSNEEFLRMFKDETTYSVIDLIGKFIPSDSIVASVLGGSIPLGVGNKASDIDLLILVDSVDQLNIPDEEEKLKITFVGEYTDADTNIVVTNVVAMVNRVEVDFSFVLTNRLRTLLDWLPKAKIALTIQQVEILSRLKNGWVLGRREGAKRDVYNDMVDDVSLEIHCAVQNWVFALQDMQDAQTSLNENLELALHLGRVCVENSFRSYFASKGVTHCGKKWLRLVRYFADPCNPRASDDFVPLSLIGLALLFPEPSFDREHVSSYISDVRKFLANLRALIETDLKFKVAFKLAPQMEAHGIA